MMNKAIGLVGFCLMAFAPLAGATEYPLQFTPNPGYRSLIVAGYAFNADGNVVGNCSYYTLSGSSGSGKGGGHGSTVTNYSQTCTWDVYGNLLTVTPGLLQLPQPVSFNGTQTIFAINASGDSTTGTDLALPERGFVTTPGAHYTWLTPQNRGVLTYQMAYTLTASLKSEGDIPLVITNVAPSALLGSAILKSTTCMDKPLQKGDTCSITVIYDDTTLTSPDGALQDTLRLDLTSNGGAAQDFIQPYTLIVAKQ